VAVAAAVGADRDALDVAGAQGAAAVQQAPLDHAAVRDQLAVLGQERVQAAERVVEGVVRDAVEDGVHQVPDG
jgi:hypothetical protein